MAKKGNIWIYVGIGGIIALILYERSKASQAATTTITTDSSSTTETSTQQAPNGIEQTVYDTVQAWAKADGRAPVLAMAAANNPTEYNGMYNLIVNFWQKGIPSNATETTFWDNLRSKYDPNHQSW